MNKEQQELLEDAYKNYAAKTSMDVDGQYTKEEFINTIKTDDEFAKTCGLKIEERELDLEERRKLILKDDPHGIQPTTDWTKTQLEDCKIQLDEWKIPTKLITVTYNDKTQ